MLPMPLLSFPSPVGIGGLVLVDRWWRVSVDHGLGVVSCGVVLALVLTLAVAITLLSLSEAVVYAGRGPGRNLSPVSPRLVLRAAGDGPANSFSLLLCLGRESCPVQPWCPGRDF